MIRFILVSLMFFGLISCVEFDSGSSEPVAEKNPEGIWIGQQAIIGDGVYDMKTLIYDGRIIGISEEAGLLFSGTYEMSHGKYLVSDGSESSTTDYVAYNLNDNGSFFSRGIVTVDVDEKESFSGAFSNDVMQEGEVSSYYSSLFERTSSLGYLPNSVSNSILGISINANGAFSGDFSGCDISGNISTSEPEKNIYTVAYSLSNCANSGIYEGLGFVSMIDDDAYMTLFASSGSRMDFFGFKLDSVPEEFQSSAENVTAARVTTVYDGIYGENHDGEDFSGAFVSATLENSSFIGADFSGSTVYAVCCSYNDSQSDRINNSDFTDADFSNANISSFSVSDYITAVPDFPLSTIIDDPDSIVGSKFNNVDFTGATVDFDADDSEYKNADFTGATLTGEVDDSDFYKAKFNDTDFELRMTSSEAVNADFRGAEFTPDPEGSYFAIVEIDFVLANLKGANFEGTDWSKLNVIESRLDYANLKDVENIRGGSGKLIATYLGNAWWTDGSRCAAHSISLCLPKLMDNGLTYEAYLNGKSDLEQDLENAKATAQYVAEEAKSVVKSVWKSIW